MAENKSKPGATPVVDVLDAIPEPSRRADAKALHDMMVRVTGEAPVVWNNGVIGFGTYSYKTSAGHSGQWMRTGFALRAKDITIHIMQGFDAHRDRLERLGPHRHGVSCLYVRRLADVNLNVLEEMVASSYRWMREAYPDG